MLNWLNTHIPQILIIFILMMDFLVHSYNLNRIDRMNAIYHRKTQNILITLCKSGMTVGVLMWGGFFS